jgi:hypothetical protein
VHLPGYGSLDQVPDGADVTTSGSWLVRRRPLSRSERPTLRQACPSGPKVCVAGTPSCAQTARASYVLQARPCVTELMRGSYDVLCSGRVSVVRLAGVLNVTDETAVSATIAWAARLGASSCASPAVDESVHVRPDSARAWTRPPSACQLRYSSERRTAEGSHDVAPSDVWLTVAWRWMFIARCSCAEWRWLGMDAVAGEGFVGEGGVELLRRVGDQVDALRAG